MSNLNTIRTRGLFIAFLLSLLISACGGSSSSSGNPPPPPPPPPPSSADILPGINPAFDAITEVATSATAGGDYVVVSDSTYDAATETITLAGDSVPAGGTFVRITGDATIGGETLSYTVYTFVATNTDSVAAHELTSLAVGHVAEGTAADFAAGVGLVATDTQGVEVSDITAATTEADRSGGLLASMIAISNQFENSSFVPGISSASATNAEVGVCVALGGAAYDDWHYLSAGGTSLLPLSEPNKDYIRCKACHGWDALGTDGGYARRSRKSGRPNAGYQDPSTASRNISGGPVTLDMILHAGTGRSWAEGSALFDMTDPTWGAGAQKGNEHPDLSQSGVNNGEVPSKDQARCLAAFLNYPDARADQVFASINPTPASTPVWCTSSNCTDYTLVATADAVLGEAWYQDAQGGNCLACHGEPEDAIGPIAPKPVGGLLAYLRSDGKYSEFKHKVQWGQSGNDLMTRANMNNPTAADIANVLAYLQLKIQGEADMESIARGGLAYDDWHTLIAGGTGLLPISEPNKDYIRCKGCHGWDALGTDGGYARRSRKSSRPNAGYQDPVAVSRNISGGSITLDMILHAGTGRSWAEGSALFDGTDPSWGAGAQKGNEHPDLSATGVNATEVPTDDQLRGLVDFLNYSDASIGAVFSAIDPNPASVPEWCTSAQCTDYTLIATADATRGEAWYQDSQGGNCLSCHGQPEDALGPIAPKPVGGLLAYLRSDGKFSEFRHKVQWGQSGNDLMIRANMGEPTAANIADVLAFLKNRIDAQVGGRPIAIDDSASTEQDVSVDIAVLANDSDPTADPLVVTSFDAVGTSGGTVACSASGLCSYTPPAGFTGTDTFGYTISDGFEVASATVTVTVTPAVPVGNVAAGQTLYDNICAVCHAAGAHDTTVAAGGNDIGGRGTDLVNAGKLISDLGSVDAVMGSLASLTDQEVLDMAAFLDTL